MKRSQFGPFDLEISLRDVTIRRGGGSVCLRAAESDALRSVLHTADGMEHLETLPSQINHSPFQVRFQKDDTLQVLRNDEHGGLGVVLAWREVDTLIQAVDAAVKISVDQKRLQPAASFSSVTPDVGEIREG